MNILQTLFDLIRNNNLYLKNYSTDFLIHDMDILKDALQGDMYAWGVQYNGTHLFKLNKIKKNPVTLNHMRAYTLACNSIDWYLIKVTKGAMSQGSLYSPPQGTVEPMALDKLIDLYNYSEPYTPVAYYA